MLIIPFIYCISSQWLEKTKNLAMTIAPPVIIMKEVVLNTIVYSKNFIQYIWTPQKNPSNPQDHDNQAKYRGLVAFLRLISLSLTLRIMIFILVGGIFCILWTIKLICTFFTKSVNIQNITAETVQKIIDYEF